MLRQVTWPQLLEWKEYFEAEPIGDKRADFHAASICCALANTMIATSGGNQRFKIADFLLEFDRQATDVKEIKEEPKAAVQRMKFIARQWTALMNAAEKADEKKKRRRRR